MSCGYITKSGKSVGDTPKRAQDAAKAASLSALKKIKCSARCPDRLSERRTASVPVASGGLDARGKIVIRYTVDWMVQVLCSPRYVQIPASLAAQLPNLTKRGF